MAINIFRDFGDSPTHPASRAFPVMPHASDDLPMATKALYIGGAGDVTLCPLDGDTDVLFTNLAAGSILDVRVRAVRAAGTTATNIVGLA